MKTFVYALCFTVLCACLAAEESAPPVGSEPEDIVGITVRELVEKFGAPDAAYAVRGNETWQDDVIFEYKSGDFYIFKDRVWQAGLRSANGIKLGDNKMGVGMIHGAAIKDMGAYIAVPVAHRSWPLEYRYYVEKDKIVSIFLSRPDF